MMLTASFLPANQLNPTSRQIKFSTLPSIPEAPRSPNPPPLPAPLPEIAPMPPPSPVRNKPSVTSSNGVVETIYEENGNGATAKNGNGATAKNGNGATAKNGNGATDEKPWYKKPVVWGITGGGVVAIAAVILLLRR